MTCAGGLSGDDGSGADLTAAVGAIPNQNVLVVPPTSEPLTLAEAKLRAGLDWPAGDPRDAQMVLFMRAARERVERDTGYALLTQTREVYLSHLVNPIEFPAPARPLQSVTEVATVDAGGVRRALPREAWRFGPGGRLQVDARTLPPGVAELYPWVVQIVVGWETRGEIPPLLQWAVGLLTAHYATAARDVVVVGTGVAEMPLGYQDALWDFRRIAV